MKSFVPSPFIHCIVARRGGAGEGIHLQRLSLEMGKWGNGEMEQKRVSRCL